MQKLFILLIYWCVTSFQGSAAGQTVLSANDTLMIHITGRQYQKLNLVFVMENQQRQICRGVKKGCDTWEFTYPHTFYEKHLYVELSVKEGMPDRLIFLRTDLKGKNLLSRHFGIPPEKGKLSLLFYKNVDDVIYNKGYTSDLFHVENPAFEVFCELQCAFFQREYSYEQNLSEVCKLIKQYPDSHYIISRLWAYAWSFKSKKDIRMLYNAFSEAAKQSYFGKKVKSLIDPGK